MDWSWINLVQEKHVLFSCAIEHENICIRHTRTVKHTPNTHFSLYLSLFLSLFLPFTNTYLPQEP